MRPRRAAARSSAVRRSDANAGRPGSYGSETLTSVRAASASSSAHSRAGQILEAVREDRLAVPGVEVGLQPLGRAAAQQVAIPEAEPVELGAVGGVERGELARRASSGSSSPASSSPSVRSERRRRSRRSAPTRARPSSGARREHAAHEQRALRAPRRPGAPRRRAQAIALEDVVEGADRAAEQRRPRARAARARRGRRPTGSAR